MAETKILLLVYGFIRLYIENKDSNTIEIPDSIKKLCASFLTLWFDIPFEWEPKRGGFEKDTIITGTNIEVQGQGRGHFRMVSSKSIISKKKYRKYEWEITLLFFS